MKKNRILSLVAGGLLGFLIWMFSFVVTGNIEPWDSETPYLSIALAASSLALSLTFKKEWLCITLGLIFGQLAYMLLVLGDPGPLILVGIVITFVWTFICAGIPALVVQAIYKNSEPAGAGQPDNPHLEL